MKRQNSISNISCALIAAFISTSCNKIVTYTLDRKPKPTESSAPPTPTADLVPAKPSNDPSPDTKISLGIKRVNADAWWKICLEAWVLEFPQTRQTIGCNTDQASQPKTVELDASTRQCNTLALSLGVYRNTAPCTGTASTCEHESSPSHIRSTTNPADRAYFRAAYFPDLKPPFARKDLQDIALPETYLKEYEQLAQNSTTDLKSKPFRVLFEDQITNNHDAWKAGASAKETGIDFFDYVIEIGGSAAPVGLEGSEFIKCPQ